MNMHLRASTYLATVLFTCLLLVGAAFAQSPSLTSDKDDYAPGSTATLTGAGFQPNELVRLQVLHADETPDTGEDHGTWVVAADDNGNFVTTWHVCEDDCIGSTLRATADGQSSGLHAEALFTDSVTSVTITSPTTGSPVTVTSLPANVTILFTYITSPTGATTGKADVLGTSASNIKSLTPGSGSDNIVVTIPSGTLNGSYNVKVTVNNATGGGANNGNDNQNAAVIVNVPSCTAPAVICPANISVNNAAGQCGAVVNFSATASGTAPVTITYSQNPGTFFPVGATTVTATATNACGSASCSFTVTVNDNQPPTLTTGTIASCYPSAAAAEADAIAATGATDNCPGTITKTASSTGTCSATVTVTATDAAGNSASTSYSTSIDGTPPVITLSAASSLGCNPTAAQIAAAFGSATVTDNCSSGLVATGTVGTETGSGCTFSTTKGWTVTDACGNTGTATQTVTYTRDTEKPVIALAAASSLGCNPTAADIAAAFGAASVSDNCSTGLTATGTVGAETGSGCTFSTTKNWTVTDACGNTGTATQTVTYTRDTELPTITPPPNVTAKTSDGGTGDCEATVSVGMATATDNCSGSLIPTGTRSDNQALTAPYPKGVTTITWKATDACGNMASSTQTVTVNDDEAPTVSCPATGTLKAPAGAGCQAAIPTVSVTASDNCTASGSLTITQSPAAGTMVGQGTHTITVTVKDAANNSATCTTDFTVTNAAPVITSVTGPTGPLALGSSASVSVIFTDETGQGYTCTFSWDDASSNTSVAGTTGSGSVTASASHTYAAAGVYTVGITVTDDCDASATSKFEYIVVYDPSAGFVTGGGWINSPAGAYTVDPNLTGKANFGFVSKYKKGANVPTGETEFQFKAGNLNFHSSSYQWLVVAGCKAQYKGNGTINGSGNYDFLLTAYDAQAGSGGSCGGQSFDRFRIKITQGSAVVYDNVPGSAGSSTDIDAANPQALGGGSIVIHKATAKASRADLEMDEEFLPTEYAIYQNYPNPFNPTTQIQFDLPENSRAKIVIYNLLGGVVATLIDENLPAGRYRKLWNGRDQSGQILPSGIYLYRIEANSASNDRQLNVVKRMVFVK